MTAAEDVAWERSPFVALCRNTYLIHTLDPSSMHSCTKQPMDSFLPDFCGFVLATQHVIEKSDQDLDGQTALTAQTGLPRLYSVTSSSLTFVGFVPSTKSTSN